MRIEDLRTEVVGPRRRASASVVWEDADRAPETIWFETNEAFGDGLSANPHAFLLASVVPALHYGESRVRMDAPVCPRFKKGVTTASRLIELWHYDGRGRMPDLQVPTDPGGARHGREREAALLFSGGVDAYASLCANRRDYPRGHRAAFSAGLVAFGLETSDAKKFAIVMEHLDRAAEQAGIALVPIYTNIYLRFRDEDARNSFRFWRYAYEGAALTALGHVFADRIESLAVAASDSIPAMGLVGQRHFRPLGSHPLLEPNYASADLGVRYDGLSLSRLEKVELVASDESALRNLRVCNQFRRYEPARVNCGRCEKCVRTMLELLAVGVLYRTGAFGRRDVSVDLAAKAVRIPRRTEADYTLVADYTELVGPLRRRGHDALAALLEKRIEDAGRGEGPSERVRRWMRRLDRQWLNGGLGRTHRRFRRRRHPG